MIFVDSGAWFASVVPTDPDHAAAAEWLAQNRHPLVTTDYILDETLTLLRVRGQNQKALALGDALLTERIASLHFFSRVEIQEAWGTFSQFLDKEWSFTDCASRVIMQKLWIATAFSFDQHFRQFGTVAVVP
jgi:predicted nucleic acid-binding protein